MNEQDKLRPALVAALLDACTTTTTLAKLLQDAAEAARYGDQLDWRDAAELVEIQRRVNQRLTTALSQLVRYTITPLLARTPTGDQFVAARRLVAKFTTDQVTDWHGLFHVVANEITSVAALELLVELDELTRPEEAHGGDADA